MKLLSVMPNLRSFFLNHFSRERGDAYTGIGTFAVGDFVVPKVGVVTGAGDALTLTEAQFWAQLLDV